MSLIDWPNGKEPDWMELSKGMAESQEKPPLDGPRPLTKRERGNPFPSLFSPNGARWAAVHAAAAALYFAVSQGRLSPWAWPWCVLCAICCVSLSHWCVRTGEQAIQQKAGWRRTATLARANAMIPGRKVKLMAQVGMAFATMPIIAFAFPFLFVDKNARVRSWVRRVDERAGFKATIDAIERVFLSKMDAAAATGPRETWKFAHRALKKKYYVGKTELDAVFAFIECPFDPRWPIGDNLRPFDGALEETLAWDSVVLSPEEREFVLEVIQLARALRESIELRVAQKACEVSVWNVPQGKRADSENNARRSPVRL